MSEDFGEPTVRRRIDLTKGDDAGSEATQQFPGGPTQQFPQGQQSPQGQQYPQSQPSPQGQQLPPPANPNDWSAPSDWSASNDWSTPSDSPPPGPYSYGAYSQPPGGPGYAGYSQPPNCSQPPNYSQPPGGSSYPPPSYPPPTRRRAWPWVTAAIVVAVLLIGGFAAAGIYAVRKVTASDLPPITTSEPASPSAGSSTGPSPSAPSGSATTSSSGATAEEISETQYNRYIEALNAIRSAKLTKVTRVYVPPDDQLTVEANGKGYLIQNGQAVPQNWTIDPSPDFDPTKVTYGYVLQANRALFDELQPGYTARGVLDVLSYDAGVTTVVAIAEDLSTGKATDDGQCTYLEIRVYLDLDGEPDVTRGERGGARQCVG